MRWTEPKVFGKLKYRQPGRQAITTNPPQGRITLHVSKNQPNSRAEYEAFPPEKYPLEIHLLFSKRYGHLVEELKAALDGIPKDKARYKKAENQYTSSVSFRCFFKDTDAMRPFVQQLRGKGLFVEPIQGEPQQVFPQELVEMASRALAPERRR